MRLDKKPRCGAAHTGYVVPDALPVLISLAPHGARALPSIGPRGVRIVASVCVRNRSIKILSAGSIHRRYSGDTVSNRCWCITSEAQCAAGPNRILKKPSMTFPATPSEKCDFRMAYIFNGCKPLKMVARPCAA